MRLGAQHGTLLSAKLQMQIASLRRPIYSLRDHGAEPDAADAMHGRVEFLFYFAAKYVERFGRDAEFLGDVFLRHSHGDAFGGLSFAGGETFDHGLGFGGIQLKDIVDFLGRFLGHETVSFEASETFSRTIGGRSNVQSLKVSHHLIYEKFPVYRFHRECEKKRRPEPVNADGGRNSMFPAIENEIGCKQTESVVRAKTPPQEASKVKIMQIQNWATIQLTQARKNAKISLGVGNTFINAFLPSWVVFAATVSFDVPA